MSKVDYSKLSPTPVWKHFQTLCHIPRPSKHEQQLRDYLRQWAHQNHLETYVDQIGNLMIKKPATQGKESIPTVIIQGHLDMVTQANSDTQHDFMKDPIEPIIDQGWLIAPNTTLGADNGIGVALALAVLEADHIAHGPLEVLLTIDEEAGMSGARYLEKNILKGNWLFNIDTEEWGELYLGCAGSQDIEIQQSIHYIDAPKDLITCDIRVVGLKGGHSGIDIHLGRGNANIILADFLNHTLSDLHGYLVEFNGGTARNALPREAIAKIAIPSQQLETLKIRLKQAEHSWLHKLKDIDNGLKFELNTSILMTEKVIDPIQQNSWLNALLTCPYGVFKMSDRLPDVVETSNNLGVVKINQNGAQVLIMVRSMRNDQIKLLASNIQQHFSDYCIPSELAPLISGWTPNPESEALKCLQSAYQNAFNINPTLKVIHAGLECGIIAEHYPHLQMVSFGPDIRGAHAPGERVNIESVEKCWTLLVTALGLVH